MLVQWQPSREGYLRFLTESKEVYQTLEGIVAEAHHPDCERSCVPLLLSYSDNRLCIYCIFYWEKVATPQLVPG